MGSSPPSLRITIIGAGIAGLTLALTLHHLNPTHDVTILEKSHFAQEIGAALFVGPNCSAILSRIGVDLDQIGGNLCEGALVLDGTSGEVRKKTDFREMRKKWKAPWMLAHRRDLHQELKRLVENAGMRIDLGVNIIEVDMESAKVKLDDGRVIEADAVVGADGNNSFTRALIDPEAKLHSFGKCAYRWLVDRKTLEGDDDIAHLVENPGIFADILGPDRKIVQYPCRDDTVFNYLAFVPEEEATGTMDSWEQGASKSRLLSSFESFAPAFQKLLSYAGDDLKIWTMVDMNALPAFNKQRLALIGDAAHPFLPFLGQGAAQAMEDAVSIALILSNATNESEAPELLGLYDRARRERVEYVRDAARKNGLDEGKGKPPPSFLFMMLDDCYTYDEWANTEAELKMKRPGNTAKVE